MSFTTRIRLCILDMDEIDQLFRKRKPSTSCKANDERSTFVAVLFAKAASAAELHSLNISSGRCNC